VHRLQFHYTLSRSNTPGLIRNALIDLLQAVSKSGSISAGARELGLSYRHVWGELRRWEDELGGELLIWEKGQAARLTEFGQKLLWAETQAQARLAPQIEALRGDLERAFAVAFDEQSHVVTLYASHDDALTALREHALATDPNHPPDHQSPRLHLDVRFCGSVDAIRGLNEGRCVMAGFHTMDQPTTGSLAERTYKPLLRPGKHKIIGFAQRMQGLIVAPGNPLNIKNLSDVARCKARFINRGLGTGTRVILDELLAQEQIDPKDISGYQNTEPSHSAIANHIAASSADVGFGIAVAAHAKGLNFVPLIKENYHLVCLKTALSDPSIATLLSILESSRWQDKLAHTTGYTPLNCGKVQSMRKVLPWWNFSREKDKRK